MHNKGLTLLYPYSPIDPKGADGQVPSPAEHRRSISGLQHDTMRLSEQAAIVSAADDLDDNDH